MPYIGNIVQDFSVNNAMLNTDSVTSIKIDDGTIVNADINDSAAIAGTKISPDFGSQIITTTGATNLNGDVTLGGTRPRLNFYDSDGNPDFAFINDSGMLQIFDQTNGANRVQINTDGHIDLLANVDISSGLDVTGNITATGTLSCGDITSSDGNGNLTLKDNNHTGNNTEHKILFSASDNTELINFISPFGEQHLRLRYGSTELVKFQIDGKVGIGTTSPGALLHVDSDSATAGIKISGDGNAFLELDADSSIAGTQIGFIDFKLAGTVEANIAVNESVSGNPLELNSATDHNITLATGGGNVGIGTAAPTCKLQVDAGSSGAGTVTHLELNHGGNNTSDAVKLNFARAGSDIGSIVLDKVSSNNTTDFIFNARLSNTVSEAMRLSGNGDLAIGTNNTSARLMVARDIADSASNNFANQTVILTGTIGGNSTNNRAGLYFAPFNSSNQYSPSAITCTAGSNYQSTLKFFVNVAGNGTGHLESYERMRINSNGYVSIGTTTNSYQLHVKGGIVDQTAVFDNSKTGDGDINYIGVRLDGGAKGVALFGHTGHTTTGSQAAWMGLGGDDVAGGFGVKCFRGGAVEMKGTLRVNTSTQYGRLHVKENSFNPNTSTWLTNASYVASSSFGGGYCLLDGSKGYSLYCHGSGSHFAIQHHSSTTATASGGVELLNAATSWSAASDERDKENLVTISDAITKIKTLRTVIGNYTWQPDIKHAFLIAQDVQAVLPEAVDIRNTYEETENQRLSLRYTEIIPLLTAALQEAVAEIDTLKTKVAALEAA